MTPLEQKNYRTLISVILILIAPSLITHPRRDPSESPAFVGSVEPQRKKRHNDGCTSWDFVAARSLWTCSIFT